MNHADPVDKILLELQSEDNVSLLSPVLHGLKDVQGPLGVAGEDLERLALFRVEAGEPDAILQRVRPGRWELLNCLKDHEPRVEQ